MEALTAMPLLANAAGIANNRCISCRAAFDGTPGASLFGVLVSASAPVSCSASTFCQKMLRSIAG
jgi:hypothetical protein